MEPASEDFNAGGGGVDIYLNIYIRTWNERTLTFRTLLEPVRMLRGQRGRGEKKKKLDLRDAHRPGEALPLLLHSTRFTHGPPHSYYTSSFWVSLGLFFFKSISTVNPAFNQHTVTLITWAVLLVRDICFMKVHEKNDEKKKSAKKLCDLSVTFFFFCF